MVGSGTNTWMVFRLIFFIIIKKIEWNEYGNKWLNPFIVFQVLEIVLIMIT